MTLSPHRRHHCPRSTIENANDQAVRKLSDFGVYLIECRLIRARKIRGTEALAANQHLLNLRHQARANTSAAVRTTHRTLKIQIDRLCGCQSRSTHGARTNVRKRTGQPQNPNFKVPQNCFRSRGLRRQRFQASSDHAKEFLVGFVWWGELANQFCHIAERFGAFDISREIKVRFDDLNTGDCH